MSVLIADAHGFSRSRLATLLADDFSLSVVDHVAEATALIERGAALAPDVALVDLELPPYGAAEVIGRLLTVSAATRVLILVPAGDEHEDPRVRAALRAGASGYVCNDASTRAITCSILTVHLGETILPTSAINRMVDAKSELPAPNDGLTPREVEILRFVASGAPNREIADLLHISENTVRNHITHMYAKLGIGSRSQAVLHAVRTHLVEV